MPRGRPKKKAKLPVTDIVLADETATVSSPEIEHMVAPIIIEVPEPSAKAPEPIVEPSPPEKTKSTGITVVDTGGVSRSFPDHEDTPKNRSHVSALLSLKGIKVERFK